MDFVPTEAQRALIERAAAIAREALAPRAAEYDRMGGYPRTATLMPPSGDRALGLIGKAMLDVRDDVLLARHAG